MMCKKWSGRAWQEYLDWQLEDKKTVKRINALIKSVERDGVLEGIGKPEPLKHNLQGWFSRRIDDENRLVYRVKENTIKIAQCKGHY